MLASTGPAAALADPVVLALGPQWLDPQYIISSLGPWALPLVVFAVAMLVVSLRSLRVMNNIVAYFLGLIAWFAAHLEPSLESFAELGGAGALGTCAGWLSHAAQQRLPRQA